MLAEPSWSWLGDPQLAPDDQLGRALTAVTSRTAPCRAGAEEPLCLSDLTFEELLDGLQLAGYVAQSRSMREAISDRDRWTARLAAKLVDRAAAVELSLSERAHRAPSDTFLAGLRLGELWARRAHGLWSAPRLDPDPSTIPERTPGGAHPGLRLAAHVLPYRVSLDVARGGAAFSWAEPSLRLLPSFSIDSIADVLAIDGSGRLSSTVGLLPTTRFRGVALGAGAQTTIPWNGERVLAPGVLARVAWLQERLALTGGVRSMESGKRQFFATVSVGDLNGLAYWLALWGAIRN
jgi:hypothetical protein